VTSIGVPIAETTGPMTILSPAGFADDFSPSTNPYKGAHRRDERPGIDPDIPENRAIRTVAVGQSQC
jgi:hypothetical protein